MLARGIPFRLKLALNLFKANVWHYCHPCEDLCSVEDDVVLDPYDGQVKSIFFGED